MTTLKQVANNFCHRYHANVMGITPYLKTQILKLQTDDTVQGKSSQPAKLL